MKMRAMARPHVPLAAWLMAMGFLTLGQLQAQVALLDSQTPWRAYLVQGPNITRQADKLTLEDGRKPAPFDPAKPDTARFSPLPPTAWTAGDFDDHVWPRYGADELADFLGDFGTIVSGRTWPTLLCLRTSFGIADPAQAGDITLSLQYLGGAVVYVNGQEVGRAAMPTGELSPLTPADDYPIEAYTTDGTTPLPALGWTAAPDAQHLPRYQKRLRNLTITIPQRLLVRGRNVLAIELHRAAVHGPLGGRGGWSHVGLRELALTSASGAGAIPYAEAIKGTRTWSAEPLDPVTDNPAPKSLVKRNWFHALMSARGMPLKGTQIGNPFDPLLPIRLATPRNGVCSGQTVLTDLAGLANVSARASDLKGPGGATISAANVQIRYAVQHDNIPYCDALMDQPPASAKTIPVWLTIQAPKDAPPGWYVGNLDLAANGKSFRIPVQLLVTGLTLPDARNFTSHIGINESPETLAMHYKVEPWSEAHFKYLDQAFALMGQVGNDVLHVPVILGNPSPIARSWTGSGSAPGPERRVPLVRWVKTASGYEPEFALLEKYLDVYSRHCAPPEALCLYLWEAACAKEMADAYEGRRIPSRDFKPKTPLLVQVLDPATGKLSEMEAPSLIDPDGEKFWKPVLEGVRAIVKKRGWSERAIMVGFGGDMRAGSKTAAALRQFAPYARWNILSHFSGDPAPKDGKLIATGDLEVGVKEYPAAAPLPAAAFEERLTRPLDFLDLPTIRWEHQEFSPPLMFRTMPLLRGDLTRLGLDFWTGGARGYPHNTSWFTHVNTMSVPGPDGPITTVRYQLLREGVQDQEVRLSVIRAYLKLPEEQRKAYRALLDQFPQRVGYGATYLSGCELAYDWPAYDAQVQQAAAELAGIKSEATWQQPPK